ncbi:MAG: family 2 glycosyl transferase [Cyclobacteriaceae bacterium]|nr:family 2 glycosyl transferase [Cyclobacteriaceae bacterium]
MDPSIYLQRYAHPVEFLNREVVSGNLGMIITIPCYNEPGLVRTLRSIHSCLRPDCDVEVIVLINQPENVDPAVQQQNEISFQEAHQWVRWNQSPSLKYYILWIKNLPAKWSGVGLARKLAMDEAVRRFRKSGNPQGIIIGFDADSTCRENYLVTVKNEFENFRLNGASIHFEHPMEGDPRLHAGIIQYELHLRYYIMAQKYAGFPYAFHTIGSSMAVRNDVYEKQGGMNKRKAGEDFYFLHKVIPLGEYKEISGTTVFPSSRESDRVPFGTGKAMLEWMKNQDQILTTYHPVIFQSLKQLFDMVEDLYANNKVTGNLRHLPESLWNFLERDNFENKVEEFRAQSSMASNFRDKFFRWFNGLKLLQYVHYAQAELYPPIPLTEAVQWLESRFPLGLKDRSDLLQVLLDIREFNRNNPGFYHKPSFR